MEPIGIAEGIERLALRTPTLPPATHTNSYVIGEKRALLVEPASPYPDEIERAVRWIEQARTRGVEPLAMVVTHHHRDHVGGAEAMAARLNLPLWGHRLTAERLPALSFERLLEDDERIELDDTAVRVMHTPGHAPGHLCLLDECSGALIAGDMVAGEGTILVEPSDGDMRAYLASLEKMAAASPTVLLPAHGEPLEPEATIARYIAHRLERERKVLEALRTLGRAASAADLVPLAYDDAPEAVWPLATLSVEAHLIKLEQDAQARRAPEGWVAI